MPPLHHPCNFRERRRLSPTQYRVPDLGAIPTPAVCQRVAKQCRRIRTRTGHTETRRRHSSRSVSEGEADSSTLPSWSSDSSPGHNGDEARDLIPNLTPLASHQHASITAHLGTNMKPQPRAHTVTRLMIITPLPRTATRLEPSISITTRLDHRVMSLALTQQQHTSTTTSTPQPQLPDWLLETRTLVI